VRVVIADDEVLLRQGLDVLLRAVGIDVVEGVGDAEALHRAIAATEPDAVLVDIKMPPGHSDEGIVAATRIRREHPAIGVLVLSHYLDSTYAMRLLEHHDTSVGYLLKERVSDVAVLVDALQRVCEGECVIDPTIVARLVTSPSTRSAISGLTSRETEVLRLMAEGYANQRIWEHLHLSPRTVEAHIGHIFTKLGLGESLDYHRRVWAVITYLRATR
jgi:DNA-binding NarL/FixJ family response regulator